METERNGKTETETPFLAHSYRTDGEGSTIEWWTFDNETIKDDLEAICHDPDYDIAYALTGEARYYSGPGRSFAHDPVAHVGKYHTLVTQCRGLDI